jgi:hypothetical protein
MPHTQSLAPGARHRLTRSLSRSCVIVLSSMICAPVPHAADAAETIMFGPKTFQRHTGAPTTQKYTFMRQAGIAGPFRIRVVNGRLDGRDRVTAGWITLNGVQLAGPADFRRAVNTLDLPVQLEPSNALEVRLAGKPGSTLSITVLASSEEVAPLPDQLYVYRILPPDVSVSRVEALALSFGFSGVLVDTPATITVAEDAERGRSLTVYKASGAIEFIDETKYQVPTYSANLPADADAVAIAEKFLRDRDLLPPNPDISLRLEPAFTDQGQIANAIAVIFAPRLPASPGVDAPVHDGDVTAWLGNAGEVIRLLSQFRKVAFPPLSVPRISLEEASAEIATERGSSSDLVLQPVYALLAPELEQPYLDPFYDGVDANGIVGESALATHFTPRLGVIGPDAGVAVTADSPVRLQAVAIEGTPPYTFTWVSNVDGPLGSGDVVTTFLSQSLHRLDVIVRDVNGAGISGSFVLQVTPGTSAAAPVPPQQGQPRPAPIGKMSSFTSGFKLRVTSDANRPLILNNVQRGGTLRARNIFFDQFWYEITVDVGGTPVRLRSQKCQAKKASGTNACVSPTYPFAQSFGASDITVTDTADTQLLKTSVTIGNLPGEFMLEFEYNVGGLEYCGPEPDKGDRFMKFLFEHSPFHGVDSVVPLGGSCPAIRPTVKWTYAPYYDSPAFFSGQTILDFCGQRAEACTPGGALAGIDRNKTYQVIGFRARLLTAVQSFERKAISSFVQDTSDKNVLGSTIGAIIKPPERPSLAPGDFLSFIDAVPQETRIVAARPQSGGGTVGGFRGDYDNVHMKYFPMFDSDLVSFPNCNWPVVYSQRTEYNVKIVSSDQQPCIHVHESWLRKFPGPDQTYSKGQTVSWNMVVFRAGQEESPDASSIDGQLKILNGESLANNGLVLWAESLADSRQCDVPGAGDSSDKVNNSKRPCVVFPNGIFFTPR